MSDSYRDISLGILAGGTQITPALNTLIPYPKTTETHTKQALDKGVVFGPEVSMGLLYSPSAFGA